MRIDLHFRPHSVVVIEPQGRLTVETEADLTQTVRGLHEAGQTHLVLSLASVTAIDSCGLGAIAQAYVSTWSRGGVLKLAHVSPRNHQLLMVTRLATVFDIHGSCEEAVRSFGAREGVVALIPDDALQGMGDSRSGTSGQGVAAGRPG